MGVKSFFKGLWNGIKKGAAKIWNGVKKVAGFAGRLVKPVVKVAPAVLSGLSALPGKAGMIGKIGAPIAGVLNGIINKMPEGAAKEKAHEIVDKGQMVYDQVKDKTMDYANKASNFGQQWLPVANHINGLVNGPPPPPGPMVHPQVMPR